MAQKVSDIIQALAKDQNKSLNSFDQRRIRDLERHGRPTVDDAMELVRQIFPVEDETFYRHAKKDIERALKS